MDQITSETCKQVNESNIKAPEKKDKTDKIDYTDQKPKNLNFKDTFKQCNEEIKSETDDLRRCRGLGFDFSQNEPKKIPIEEILEY